MARATVEDSTAGLGRIHRTGRPLVGGFSFHGVSGLCLRCFTDPDFLPSPEESKKTKIVKNDLKTKQIENIFRETWKRNVSNILSNIQVRTVLGDAKLNIAMFSGLPNWSLLSTILFQPDHHIDFLHAAPKTMSHSCDCNIPANVWLVCHVSNFSGVCTDDTEHRALHCFRAAGTKEVWSSGMPLATPGAVVSLMEHARGADPAFYISWARFKHLRSFQA